MTRLYRVFTFVTAALMFTTYAFLNTVSAVSVSPASGNLTAGATQTINITASPTASGQNAVSLRLSVTGMTITGYTRPTSFIGVTSDCSGGTDFTSTQLCVSMAKSTNITAGESLGSITVRVGTSGTATITKDSGTAYSDGTNTVPSTGVAGTYTIVAASSGNTGGNTGNSGGTLPNTSVGVSSNLFIALGLTFLSLGALSYVSISSLKRK